MRCLLGLAVLFGALHVTPRSLDAQDALTGLIRDSLGLTHGLADFEVAILGTLTRARADSLGRFVLVGAPKGEFTVVAWAPILDTLGIPFIHRRVTAGIRSTLIELATPSWPSIQHMHCGTTLDAEQGILVGESRTASGSSVSDQVVWASWSEYFARGSDLQTSSVATADTTDESGSFVLCGVPLHRTVELRSRRDTLGTGVVLVSISRSIQRHDLVVGLDSDTIQVQGRLLASGPSTGGVVGAEIRLADDATARAITDSSGEFRLLIPRRSSVAIVRAIGYAAITAHVPVLDAQDSVWVIRVEEGARALPGVAVTADVLSAERAEFERRRSVGLGRFITDEMLEGLPSVTPNIFRSMVPNLAVQGAHPPRLMLRGSTTFGYCDPRIFEDGLDRGVMEDRDERIELAAIISRAKRMEVYSASSAPSRFNDNNGCGSIVIWTR